WVRAEGPTSAIKTTRAPKFDVYVRPLLDCNYAQLPDECWATPCVDTWEEQSGREQQGLGRVLVYNTRAEPCLIEKGTRLAVVSAVPRRERGTTVAMTSKSPHKENEIVSEDEIRATVARMSNLSVEQRAAVHAMLMKHRQTFCNTLRKA